ncbi:MAG: hypothetical protein DMG67_00070 [Acidobacteria bacterium]|nr:MAG: hypothetical protein DMG67_00070 [Acidobacteriota bacterium]
MGIKGIWKYNKPRSLCAPFPLEERCSGGRFFFRDVFAGQVYCSLPVLLRAALICRDSRTLAISNSVPLRRCSNQGDTS